MFVPSAASCGIDGVTLTAAQAYPLTISAAPARIDLSVGSSAIEWDGVDDWACQGSSTSALEIGWEGGFARAAFIGAKPSSFLLGYCLGELQAISGS